MAERRASPLSIPPGIDPTGRSCDANRSDRRPSVALVCARVPSDRAGHTIRTWTIAGALARVGRLCIIVVAPSPGTLDQIELPDGEAVPLRWATNADLAEALEQISPAIVIADDLPLARSVLDSAVPVIVISQNLESEMWADAARTGHDGTSALALRRARTARLLERDIVSRADQVWVVSDADRTGLLEVGRGMDRAVAEVLVVPNVVPDPPELERQPIPNTAAFFGSLWWEPNRRAVEELLDLVERLGPDDSRRFVVAGAGAPEALVDRMRRTPGVEAPGFVEDLRGLLSRTSCVVLPVTSGGGSMVKLVEAMALGCPVLTTPQGARGVAGLVDGDQLVIRPLGPAFDDACRSMVSDPRPFEALGRRAHEFVRRHLCSTAIEPLVADLVGRAIGPVHG